jgi:alkylresorcinol/alkylpyrone synthase
MILDRGLTAFLAEQAAGAVDSFLSAQGLNRERISHFILHPGGRRIIDLIAEKLGLARSQLAATEAVLQEHGNMSSVTVLFVLDEILRGVRPRSGELGLMGAFGPGFGAEFLLLEFS